MAAGELSCLARNGRSPGEESFTGAVAAQAIEAQPVFGQIKPGEAVWLACDEQHPREKTWRTSLGPHKRFGIPGEGKEILAYRKAAIAC